MPVLEPREAPSAQDRGGRCAPGSQRRIRILRVITRLNIGGPAIHVDVATNRLDRSRYETTLVAGRPASSEGDLAPRVASAGGTVLPLASLQRELHPLRDAAAWWQLARLILRLRPDIIHTHTAKAGALGRSAAWAARQLSLGRYRPVVVHTFHGHVLDGYFSAAAAAVFTAIERALARTTDRLIAVSPSVKEDLAVLRIAPAEKIIVIPLGLPLEPFLEVDGRRGIWRSPDDRDACLVAWAGRLVPIQQPELFIEGMARLQPRLPRAGCRGIIAGDGERRRLIETMLRERPEAPVACVGWVTDMAGLYADADVVCLTSANEGTPVALIEAMAAGRPVIATAVGGVPDVLGVERAQAAAIIPGTFLRGEGGLLVRPGDAEGLASALAAIAADPVRRAELGREGRRRVAARYAASRLVRDLETLYDHLLSGTRAV